MKLFEDTLLKQHENILSEMSQQLVNDFGLDVLWDITGVNCSAHTLQLAIKDALKLIALKNRNVISLCRNVAKSLRLKSTRHTYKEEHGREYKIPGLNVETRWGSTYTMVSLLFYQ